MKPACLTVVVSRIFAALCLLGAAFGLPAYGSSLEEDFPDPPDSARPGVYWYFMDGNLDRDEMILDLDAMKEAGLGHVVHLEPLRLGRDDWMDFGRVTPADSGTTADFLK